MLEASEVRLRIVECVIHQATRVGIFDPSGLIESCTQLEKYVLDSKTVEELPAPTTRKTLHRPEKTTEKKPDWMK